ncbi:M28 family peptidase [Aestuariivivens sediminis]|uniref:M28 family peptidase n=1 Tax=Aestuariivivens sediminis TaxID=2913557 RepID=UPI001F5A275C|nr:M28 family peptidase [Aestuariivivens sediminis]
MIKKAIAVILIIGAVVWSFTALMPGKESPVDVPQSQFSTKRALRYLKRIARAPHYLGSAEHNRVRDYIVKQLKGLGLETQIQEGFSVDDSGNLAKAKNIIGRIRGRERGKALLLLTHYDSDPHGAIGASDAGSGVVTILEGLRAFLSADKSPKNDIIILISDAEELGLNGANIFVNQHEWAKDVGLVLNFEARGSGGPGIMFIETNHGNANIIKGFVQANPQYPVGNSLFYSIYKILPNDTDLTVFREDGDIDGINLAFIDDHFDYHTPLDNYDRLDRNSLAHQGSYIMAMLPYFSEVDLEKLTSNEDEVFFNMPIFNMVTYPFSWIYPMLIIAIISFVVLLIYGVQKNVITAKAIGKGILAFVISLVLAAAIGYYSWEVLLMAYPQYTEILHGFTYNGQDYIWAFTSLSLALCCFVYHSTYKKENTASLLVGPIAIWFIICAGVAFKLKGASFFVIPVYFALLSLFVCIRQKQPNMILMALLGFPVLTIIGPFVQLFPVGLGLKLMMTNTVFVVLIFGLMLSVFAPFKHKKRWGYVFTLFTIYFLVTGHMHSGFSKDRPKPNSLLYVYNADDSAAVWATYDKHLDGFTEPFFGPHPNQGSVSYPHVLDSKYKTPFTFTQEAPIKAINPPLVHVIRDTVIHDARHIALSVIPQRAINRMEVFKDSLNSFQTVKANGLHLRNVNTLSDNRLLSYYVTDQDALALQFVVSKSQNTQITLYEASYDLLESDRFNIPQRSQDMIPKPFVLNDAILVKRTIMIPPKNN